MTHNNVITSITKIQHVKKYDFGRRDQEVDGTCILGIHRIIIKPIVKQLGAVKKI